MATQTVTHTGNTVEVDSTIYDNTFTMGHAIFAFLVTVAIAATILLGAVTVDESVRYPSPYEGWNGIWNGISFILILLGLAIYIGASCTTVIKSWGVWAVRAVSVGTLTAFGFWLQKAFGSEIGIAGRTLPVFGTIILVMVLAHNPWTAGPPPAVEDAPKVVTPGDAVRAIERERFAVRARNASAHRASV